MFYQLIMIVALTGGVSNQGYGGVSVHTSRFETKTACETVKNSFLEIGPTGQIAVGDNKWKHALITKDARCVEVKSHK